MIRFNTVDDCWQYCEAKDIVSFKRVVGEVTMSSYIEDETHAMAFTEIVLTDPKTPNEHTIMRVRETVEDVHNLIKYELSKSAFK